MTWNKFCGNGGEPDHSLVDICLLANASGPGVVEVKASPFAWELLCRKLGSQRTVTLSYREEQAVFETGVCGRKVSVSSLLGLGIDEFEYRVKR